MVCAVETGVSVTRLEPESPDRFVPLRRQLGVTAFGNSIRAAVDAPRLHHQWLPDSTTIEPGTVTDATIAALRARGQAVRLSTGRQGDAHSIWIDPKTGIAYGAPDHRSPDSKASAPR